MDKVKFLKELADRMEASAVVLFEIHDQVMSEDIDLTAEGLFINEFDVDRIKDVHDAGCCLQALAWKIRHRAAGLKPNVVKVAVKQTMLAFPEPGKKG